MPESSVQLSIIIPVYNVEPYLARCLDSILQQDFTDWEIIAVDDGSSDGSGRILDEYAARDSRIRAIHKANGGVSSARNAGLDAARGEYLGFVDGDDLIAPDMYARLTAEAYEGNFDLVQCDYHDYFEDGSSRPHHAPREPRSWNSREEIMLACLNSEIIHSVCTKLIRRSAVGSLRFDETLAIAEDALFVSEICSRIRSARRIDPALYFYFQRSSSVMHEKLTEKQFGRMETLRRQMEMSKDSDTLYFAAARKAAREAFSLISMVTTQSRYRERLPELRSFALQNRRLLIKKKESGRRLRMQLMLLWLFPRLYYKINLLRSRLLGR